MTKDIIVLISGSGTNLQALIDDAEIGPRISLVISSSPTAYGLERAQKAGIKTHVHSLASYYGDLAKDAKTERLAARQKFNADLGNYIVAQKDTALVVCAGWMLILSPKFLEPVEKAQISIINLHPALPGAFAGIRAIERAWEAGQKGELTKGGVMIHYVIAAVDEGEPLVVKELDMKIGESLDEYEDRVHKVEHVAIVEGAKKALMVLRK